MPNPTLERPTDTKHKLASADQHALTATAIQLDANGALPTRIPLFVTGNWPNSIKGDFAVDLNDLKQMKENFEAGIGFPTDDASTGLAIDIAHNYADQAAGWIKGLELEVDPNDDTKGTLYANPVDWTPVGTDAIQGGKFKCISPMGFFGRKNGKLSMWSNTSNLKEKVANVLEGAGLTNIPFLKGMSPIRADKLDENDTGYVNLMYVAIDQHKKEQSMNLDALRVKEPAELEGAEYKFLAEQKAELSKEEQEKFSLEVPEANQEDEVSEEDRATLAAIKSGDKKLVDKEESTVDQTRLDSLEATAKKYEDEKAQEIVDEHVSRGAIKQDSSEGWKKRLLSATGEDRTALEADLKALPDNKILAEELGSGEDTAAGSTAREQLSIMASKKVEEAAKDGKELLFGDALKQVARENPDLQKQDLAEQGVA